MYSWHNNHLLRTKCTILGLTYVTGTYILVAFYVRCKFEGYLFTTIIIHR